MNYHRHHQLLWNFWLLLTVRPLYSHTTFTNNVNKNVENAEPMVCAPNSGCMQGVYMPGYRTDRFEAFLGIPYALAPLGELRFSSPKTYPKWQGIYNASVVKPDCIQKNYLLPDPMVYGEEDCLYLNVYRPDKRITNLMPVMVYIHGGGFFSGSASPQITGPEYFMDTGEVILVTMAYRLGAFGFLSTDDINMPGNFGLKDQNLALRWVQKNIAYFGGDAKQVTLFGQSAGAVAAHMHVLSKQSKGLFRNIIALSGTANVPFAITENPLEQARQTAALCNITNAQTLSTVKLTRALRNVDATTLINAGDGLKFWDVDHLTNYRPTVERSSFGGEAFLTDHPKNLLASGNYEPLPWLVGGVPEEGAVRVIAIMENDLLRNSFNRDFDELLQTLLEFPSYLDQNELPAKMARIVNEYFGGQHELNNETAQGFLDTISDRGFKHPLYNAIQDYIHTVDTKKYPVYLYRFNYSGLHSYANIYTNVEQRNRDYGVVHCDDLIYLFRSPLLFPDFEHNSTDAKMSKAFIDYLIHFAKYSKPIDEPKFCPCTSETLQKFSDSDSSCDYHEFVNSQPNTFEIKTDNKYNVKRIKLWREILEE